MSRVLDDARAEYDALATLLQGLEPALWQETTPFYSWSIADQVMHLLQVDEFALIALDDEAQFEQTVKQVRANQAQGVELSQMMRESYGHLSPGALLDHWVERYTALLARFDSSVEGEKIPWFGPPMRATSLAAARQMEVWAHGQDIYDTLGRRRVNEERLLNICDLGVRTQGWSFRNRGLEKPDPPRVELVSPGGHSRAWNDQGAECIEGLAEDFAMVVTQRRHVADTSLTVVGKGAQRWMEIAQCFAGAAAEGPVPGERVLSS